MLSILADFSRAPDKSWRKWGKYHFTLEAHGELGVAETLTTFTATSVVVRPLCWSVP
jgi:hypothetical protein